MQVRKIRILRHECGISLVDLARTCGVTRQRISELELDTEAVITPKTKEAVARAFSSILDKRWEKFQRQYRDFEKHRDSLMDCVEECEYEL